MKAIILHILLGALPVLAQVPQVGTPATITTEKDPLHHLVYLEVLPSGMKVVKVEHEVGEWENGEWKQNNKAEQGAGE